MGSRWLSTSAGCTMRIRRSYRAARSVTASSRSLLSKGIERQAGPRGPYRVAHFIAVPLLPIVGRLGIQREWVSGVGVADARRDVDDRGAVGDEARDARRAAETIRDGGGAVRYLGSILVPGDEIALCLFEAASLEAAQDVNRRADIPSERILEIVRLGLQ